MSEELMIRHCSPTLAGLKTGSLFSCPFASEEELRCGISGLNKKLVPKGLRVLPLQMEQGRALIYVYRVSDLQRDLQNGEVQEILLEAGYKVEQAERCVHHLMQRLRAGDGFPHEIGLFLSYPAEDVRGFMENRACGHKCVGCWKVYGDVEAAKRCFAKYEKCTRVYSKCWQQGVSLERLTVAG